jgi:glutamyl-tRNA synthetase
MGDLGIDPADGPDLVEVVRVQQERAKTLVEMAQISAFFYRDFDDYDEAAAKKNLRPVAIEPLTLIRKVLAELEDWTPDNLHQAVVHVAESLDLKLGKIAQPLRVAVAGRAASPGIDVTLHLVGREACMRRIDRALDYIGERMEDN